MDVLRDRSDGIASSVAALGVESLGFRVPELLVVLRLSSEIVISGCIRDC